ncbi:transferase hexapeptide (six repeat-containing protein) [Cruoricaptor ignavus]|uniref:Transferase hexapeptide (Six repeat-containing protein) n=1 Tax=Cruoricaptor ignavus TaxID=1118202 RepID=A0A1M6DVZ1_9FLAO|nr:acyltransferase [Cruoricaptor ignavus]SHI77299.1 transferase hexapeptide (six repeat-containing protein) [Cruoricaptor ignavus]
MIERFYYLLKNFHEKEAHRKIRDLGFKSVGNNFSLRKDYCISGAENISIGHNFHAMARLRMEAVQSWMGEKFEPQITIGNDVTFNSDVQIQCINKVEIGNNCLFAGRIFVSDHDHGNTDYQSLQIPPSERNLVSKGAVIIEDNVWIGQGVVILSGVRIGKNAVIASNAVVTKDIPAYSVAGGIPAKIIKESAL